MSPWTQSYAKAADKVNAELTQAEGLPNPMSAPEMAAAAKLAGGSGGDGGSPEDRRHRLLDASLDKIWENLKYCAFLLDAEVTAPALLSLASSILLERGS